MTKKILFLVGSFLTISTNTFSMLSKWDHRPITNEYTLERIEWDDIPVPEVDYSNILHVIEPTNEYYEGPYSSCFEKAMHQTTGVVGLCGFIPGNNKYTSINIEKYFRQVHVPKNGDLVVYTANSTDLTMRHFGVVADAQNMLVESQWGTNEECIFHKFHAVPFMYGKAGAFFELKNEYKGKKNKSALKKEIEADYKAFIVKWNKNQKKATMVFKEAEDNMLSNIDSERKKFLRLS